MQGQLLRRLYNGQLDIHNNPHNLQLIQILDMGIIVLPFFLLAHLLLAIFEGIFIEACVVAAVEDLDAVAIDVVHFLPVELDGFWGHC